MGISRVPSGSIDTSASLDALRDPAGNALKARAASDPKAAIKMAAKQFEALFMQQLMKSMREATVSSGMLDNAGTQMGTEMLDTQFANQMTGLKGGLSDVIMRQLERQMNGSAPPALAVPAAAAAGAASSSEPAAQLSSTQSDFVRVHTQAARAAEAETGIPATFMVAQAAHESGWGKQQIRNADGSSAFNLFGIKAGAGWKGATTSITTTEVEGGQARKVIAKFRSYANAEASFKDYAQLMKDNPRYAAVLAAGNNASGFAQGLQRAGYATDPAYADKLTRVINTTLRLQRASA
jgi:peptidoglycan hydrolase FlgJ